MRKIAITISRSLFEELAREKEKLGARSLEDTISTILREYRRFRRLRAL